MTATSPLSPIPAPDPEPTPRPAPERPLTPAELHFRDLASSMLRGAAAQASRAAETIAPDALIDGTPRERRGTAAEAIVAGSEAVALSRHAALLLAETGMALAGTTAERAWSRASAGESTAMDVLGTLHPTRQARVATTAASELKVGADMLASAARVVDSARPDPDAEPIDPQRRHHDMLVDATRFGSAAMAAASADTAGLDASDRYRRIGSVLSLSAQATVAAEQLLRELQGAETSAAGSALAQGAALMRASVDTALAAVRELRREQQTAGLTAAAELLGQGMQLVEQARDGLASARPAGSARGART